MYRNKRFSIKTSADNLPHLRNLKLRNLQRDNQQLTFFTDKTSLTQLEQLNINYTAQDRLLTVWKSIFKKRLVTIIGILLLVILLINQSLTITQIHFVDEENYNQEILDNLNQYIKKVGPFKYLNSSLANINQNLRTDFFEYEWISLQKQGTFLYIDLKHLSVKDNVFPPSDVVGDLIAKTDAIVRYYYIQKGVLLVQELQSVSQGDILVSGNLKYHNESDEHKYILPEGYVIGEVISYHDFSIPKNMEIVERTGRVKEKTIIKLFNKKLFSKKSNHNFTEFDTSNDTKFKLGKFFSITKELSFEQKSIKTIYTEEDAIKLAKSLVRKDFLANKINDLEQIIFIEEIRTIAGNDTFEIKLISKQLVNIAELSEVNLEENE